jgi:ABC-type bacteriocin/lantibiotic exporter with double-glycine peptidase domain
MNIVYYLLGEFFKEEKFNISIITIISFVINLLQTNSISYITANIIEEIGAKNQPKVLYYFYFFVAISAIFILLYAAFKHYQNIILAKLKQWIRHHLLRVLMLVNNENFSEMNFLKMNSPINRIGAVCYMVFNDVIIYLLPNFSFLIMVGLFFLYKHFALGLIFALGNVLLTVYFLYYWDDMLLHSEAYEARASESEAYMIEILNNIDKIIFRGQTENEIEVFSKKVKNSTDASIKFNSNVNDHGTIMYIIAYVFIFIFIFELIRLFFQKRVDFKIFITFFTIILLYRDKIMSIIQQLPDFIEFLGRTDSILKHFEDMKDKYDDVLNKPVYKEHDLAFENVRFENITFQYSSNHKKVFELSNFSVDTNNTIIGITGLSGNGKSTFAKLLLKMYKPENGAIYIDDVDLMDIDTDYIRKNITYVSQNSKLFDKKITENVFYGCNDQEVCARHLEEILKYDKIRELYKNMNIYEKDAGSLGENLSGGQRQITNIISGLVNPSKILILDEPTNALDPGLKKELLKVISDFKKYKKCIIIITHDSDVYSLFDDTINI